jgi:hypothetical protein
MPRTCTLAPRKWTGEALQSRLLQRSPAAHPLLQTSVHLGQLVLPGLIALGSAAAQELRPEEIYQCLLPSVVTLQVEGPTGERYVGTGFLALTNDTVVTAWHTIADARRVTARFVDNEFAEALGVVDKDEKSDLALVRLPVSSRPRVRLGLSEAPVGSRAYVIGAPKGYEFSIADGLISQMQQVEGVKQYQVSCPISGGNSGGPLINGCGEVIGVTSWSKADAQNINFATPSACLLALDSALTPKPWSELVNSSSAGAKHAEGTRPASTADSGNIEKNLLEFKQALKGAVGKEVTVFLVKEGRAESFTFVLPQNLFDERELTKGCGSQGF